ncbi:putative DNA repair protein YkoV [Streptomyces sp. ADI96-02]|uniref:non-homologous end joining protein Ku n=1 Tax=Streptomyces sp. ADI96-02 TaxID=1522760 RepID=UPI000F55372C|nr:Ku protein [Streptomyces sp. ADI96-02]RPK58021.1 putative DNA repair protein YkoV [Streptomyces sp. ADI96-02]
MRSIWNGAISFGLVSIPVKLINATENHAVSFRQIHLADGGRIRYRKVCELDEEEVGGAEVGKAYEDADGTMIPITDEDLAQLPLPTAKTIEIVAFVPAGAIDPLQMDAAYYLSANGVPAAKPYTLLREALRRSDRVAVAKYALRGRERLGMLRVVDQVIAMHALLWPDEIRAPEGVAPDAGVTVRDAELDLADALMNTLGDVDVDGLHDDYRAAVEELVAAKAAGEEPDRAASDDSEGGQVIDLLAALENSVRAAEKSRGGGRGKSAKSAKSAKDGADGGDGDGGMADVHPIRKETAPGRSSAKAPGKAPGRRSTAKKTASAKSPARTSTAKKSTAKKSTAKKATAKNATAKKSTAKKSSASKSATGKTASASSSAPSSSSSSSGRKRTSSSAGRGDGRKTATAHRRSSA